MCSLDFSSNSQILASGSVEGLIILWNIEKVTIIRAVGGHSHLIYTLIFSLGSGMLVSGSRDSSNKLWDTASGAEQQIPDDHSDSVWPAFYSINSENLLSLSDSCICIKGKTPLWLPAKYRACTCHAVMGNTLALGYTSGKVLIIGFKE